MTRLRVAGWTAYWLRSFRCGPEVWQDHRGDETHVPAWVFGLLQTVRRRRGVPDAANGREPLGGVPDVVAYKEDPRALVFVECKRQGEPIEKQAPWIEAALGTPSSPGLLRLDQMAVVVSDIRLPDGSLTRARRSPERSSRGIGRGQHEVSGVDAAVPRWSAPDDLAVSEVYREHTIRYSKSMRTWIVELSSGQPPGRFSSAFQARRAINMVLDGSSVTWPKRGP